MISVADNKFRRIPQDEFVLGIIQTAKPRVALEVAYLSGKKKVIAAVQARIASYRAGHYSVQSYEGERVFYTSIRQFCVINDSSFLTTLNGKLAIANKVSPNKQMIKDISKTIAQIVDRINERKFKPLTIVNDCLEQKKTIETYKQVTNNLEILFNRTIKKYKSSILEILNDKLYYLVGQVHVTSHPLILCKKDDILITVDFSRIVTIEVKTKNDKFEFTVLKDSFTFSSIVNPRYIHYLAARVCAELYYNHPQPKEFHLNVERAWRPIVYALGLAPFSEKAEKKYASALQEGKKFSRSSKGLERNITIEPRPKDPKTLEKREKILANPLLKGIDSDIYNYV